MDQIKINDLVGRKSYGCDIFFKVIAIFIDDKGQEQACLKGLDMRLLATAPVDDLYKLEPAQITAHWHNFMTKNHNQMKRIFQRRQQDQLKCLNRSIGLVDKIESFDVPGTVLHLDGDNDYLELCLTTYRPLNIRAHGYNIKEKEQSEEISAVLTKHRPDILVLTGHDGLAKGAKELSDLNNYHSSKYFVAAIKIARQYEKSLDDLVIFAGACQSHYEAILRAGANFASSPKRILIHAFDPVFVVEKIAYTSIYDPIPVKDVIASTITGFDGIGGIETKGKFRLGVPKTPY
jgi:spore coat assembly protein